MVILAQRVRQPELMDQPNLDGALHAVALAGLGRINAISRTAKALWRPLSQLARGTGTETLRVLDVASGGGDVAIRCAHLALRSGMALEIHGCDISHTAVAFAKAAGRKAGLANVHFAQRDVFEQPLPDSFDVVMCSLFLHHLSESDSVELLRRMVAAARRAVLVDDLVRSPLGLALAWMGCRLLTRSRIVHTDGPLSVRAAYSLTEVRALADSAGLRGAHIRCHWPERFLLSWTRL